MRKNPVNFLLLRNKQNNALVLINSNHSDVEDYKSSGFESIEQGSENDCLESADEFWSEENIPEDLRLLLTVK